MREYFWEYEYSFGEFLKKIFPNTYKRKYSLKGNGIYNLILVNDKIYEVKFKQATKILQDNNIYTSDSIKNKIIDNIRTNLKNKNIINSGILFFNLDNFVAKVEVIKKMKMPE